jgi:anti-sigma regulatory factor (Ser/Thr protein kinase)
MSQFIDLSPNPASVARARHWSRDVVGPIGGAEVVDTVALLVSELVSNVVLHANTPCSLRIDPGSERIRVEVQDLSDRLPAAAPLPGPSSRSGRGLPLVRALSAAHGIDPDPAGGKRVWFEVDVAPHLAPEQ